MTLQWKGLTSTTVRAVKIATVPTPEVIQIEYFSSSHFLATCGYSDFLFSHAAALKSLKIK